MRETVLITGITGFLGCHIAEVLLKRSYHVLATKRSSSDLKNCSEYVDKVTWIDISKADWKEHIIGFQPQIIIHCAWIGVEASQRNDWELQSENFNFLEDILNIAIQSKTKKLIGLGSQAEYGYTESIVPESYPLNPTTAYGAVKIITSQLVKKFCSSNNIEWYWLRVFSVYGEKESGKWLMPSLIHSIIHQKGGKMDFTGCEQMYTYLYVNDFANGIMRMVECSRNLSGIYNISSRKPVKLKNIITKIRDMLDSSFILNFGALPYRPKQSMLMGGDMTNFCNAFGDIESTDFENGIIKTLKFYNS